jgi:hypothetical protein
MKEQASAEKFRSIKAFKEFEESSGGGPSSGPTSGLPEERSLGAAGGPALADEVSSLRVLAAVKRRDGGVRRSELVHELHASPEAVESAVLRLVKEGLVTVKAGAGRDEILIA